MRKTIAAATLMLALVGAGAGTASAETMSTDYTGACNMMHDPTMMSHVMTVISTQGATGMMGAATASGGSCPGGM